MSAKNGRRTNWSGSYLALPRIVMQSDSYRNLSGSALKVLLMVFYRYTGKNNGDLEATGSRARKWGVASDQTLAKAIKELQEANLIIRTRQPQFLNPGGKCALYAVTWLPIDECGGKLDCSARKKPSRKFSMEQAGRPLQKL